MTLFSLQKIFHSIPRIEMLALLLLIISSGCISPPGGKESLAYCKSTFSEDMTHRLNTTYHDGSWHCNFVLMSCNLDGTGCYSIGITDLGEVKKI